MESLAAPLSCKCIENDKPDACWGYVEFIFEFGSHTVAFVYLGVGVVCALKSSRADC